MKTRLISAIVGILIFLIIVYLLPPLAAVFAFSLICTLSAYEFLGATKVLKGSALIHVCALTAFFVPLITTYSSTFNILTMVYVFTLVVFLWGIFNPKKVGFEQISKAYLGAIIIPFLLSSVIRILVLGGNGRLLVLMPFVTAWCSDSGALLVGLMFGKHKLAPQISPKKTIEGAFGGIAGGVIGILIFALISEKFFKMSPNYLLLCIAGIVGSIAGEIGDLSLSLIKRDAGIKDYGKIMPGHGGVLDRFDSVLFVAPLFEILMHFTKII